MVVDVAAAGDADSRRESKAREQDAKTHAAVSYMPAKSADNVDI